MKLMGENLAWKEVGITAVYGALSSEISFDLWRRLLEWQVRAARSTDQRLLVSGYQGI